MWYNQTEVATKTELENVKGMIEVSARLVATMSLDGKHEQLVECDYAIISYTVCVKNANKDITAVHTERGYITPGGSGGIWRDVTFGKELTYVFLSLNTSYYLEASSELSSPLNSCIAECYKYQ